MVRKWVGRRAFVGGVRGMVTELLVVAALLAVAAAIAAVATALA